MITFFIPNQSAFDALVVSEEPVIVEVPKSSDISTSYRRPRRRHHVRGYCRKDGTYVSSHSRKG